jgi:protein-arginine kinase activator protein McsA
MTSVANCTQCKRIFRKQLSPLCPECHQIYMEKLSSVYRFVQENPHLTLEDIAERCSLPFREVESLFFQGKLGTATGQVIYHCQFCNRPLAASMRKGRFCAHCSEQFEAEAGLNEPEVEKTRAKTRFKAEALARSDTMQSTPAINEEPAASPESYGFKRINSESF